MNLRGETFHKADIRITRWMSNYGLMLLRISIGIVFFWFGILRPLKGNTLLKKL